MMMCALFVSVAMAAGCASQQPPAPPEQTRAEADFEAGAKRPPTAKTMFAMAQILATQGKDSDAQFVLKKIIAEHPEFLPAYCELAELQMRSRRVEDAVRILNSGLRLAPRDPVLINDLGMCQLMSGDCATALQTFTRACGLAPDEARYRANMAAALGLLGRYDEALSLYQDVMAPADAHYNLAVLCDARHDTLRADSEYKRAALLAQPADHSGAEASAKLRSTSAASPAAAPANALPAD
jgi:Flp pilus assembly protein TadD